ncbi:hypothetical protein BD413DRAFT_612271 [Trametes elegans]|nr:hypothetical protein BD413DRAFT_612271 [Trametes elegans]
MPSGRFLFLFLFFCLHLCGAAHAAAVPYPRPQLPPRSAAARDVAARVLSGASSGAGVPPPPPTWRGYALPILEDKVLVSTSTPLPTPPSTVSPVLDDLGSRDVLSRRGDEHDDAKHAEEEGEEEGEKYGRSYEHSLLVVIAILSVLLAIMTTIVCFLFIHKQRQVRAQYIAMAEHHHGGSGGAMAQGRAAAHEYPDAHRESTYSARSSAPLVQKDERRSDNPNGVAARQNGVQIGSGSSSLADETTTPILLPALGCEDGDGVCANDPSSKPRGKGSAGRGKAPKAKSVAKPPPTRGRTSGPHTYTVAPATVTPARSTARYTASSPHSTSSPDPARFDGSSSGGSGGACPPGCVRRAPSYERGLIVAIIVLTVLLVCMTAVVVVLAWRQRAMKGAYTPVVPVRSSDIAGFEEKHSSSPQFTSDKERFK